MVHLGPLNHIDVLPKPVPWTLDHQVHLFAQTESRPGPLTDEGERWMERQQTGKVMVVCTCGYSSGLVDRSELTSTVTGLADEHSAPSVASNPSRPDRKGAGQINLI